MAVAAPLFGLLFDKHMMSGAFWLAALLPVAGFAVWWLLAHRPIEAA